VSKNKNAAAVPRVILGGFFYQSPKIWSPSPIYNIVLFRTCDSRRYNILYSRSVQNFPQSDLPGHAHRKKKNNNTNITIRFGFDAKHNIPRMASGNNTYTRVERNIFQYKYYIYSLSIKMTILHGTSTIFRILSRDYGRARVVSIATAAVQRLIRSIVYSIKTI